MTILKQLPNIADALSSITQPPIEASTVLDQIGNTPLIDLSAFAHVRGISSNVGVYAKAEWLNPGGSIKTRPALRIIEEGERAGALTPDKIIIDSSSGNTAIGLALVGAAKGYDVHVVLPANVSAERKALVKAYGATLIESDPLEGSDGAIRQVREIVEGDPDRYFYANQYNNPANWWAHYDTTGPEIWRQTHGRITHFVAGLGTTGTIVGVGRFLKKQNRDVQIAGVQPVDELSVIEGLKFLETAITPEIYDADVADRDVRIDSETAYDYTRQLAREAGLFVGFSSGAAVAACMEVARELDKGVLVTVLPDDGSKYISLGIFD